jgi:hypothetical protein
MQMYSKRVLQRVETGGARGEREGGKSLAGGRQRGTLSLKGRACQLRDQTPAVAVLRLCRQTELQARASPLRDEWGAILLAPALASFTRSEPHLMAIEHPSSHVALIRPHKR